MFFVALASILFIGTSLGAQLDFTNTSGGQMRIKTLGNPGSALLENGGFDLGAGQSKSIQAPNGWAGRFWVKDGGTLIEMQIKAADGHDYYDISLVDSYSGPSSIKPVGGCCGDCKALVCNDANCPDAYHHPNDVATHACNAGRYAITFG